VLCILALIAVGLSACGGNAVPPGTTNTSYGQSKSTQAEPARTTRPVVRKKPESSKTGKTVAAIPFKRIPSDTLKGLSEDAFEAKVGTPEMIRGEGDIQVWQYRSEQCSFDAFFVPKAEGAPRELRHMLARMRRGNSAITVQDCLDQIVKLRLSQG
jgi:hypothetical protein